MEYLPQAEKQIELYTRMGFGGLPICMAKTQYSFSADAAVKVTPSHSSLLQSPLINAPVCSIDSAPMASWLHQHFCVGSNLSSRRQTNAQLATDSWLASFMHVSWPAQQRPSGILVAKIFPPSTASQRRKAMASTGSNEVPHLGIRMTLH